MDEYADNALNPIFDKAIMDRIQRSVIRDKNNACVLMWSYGNETGWGPSFEKAGAWVREYDPSRLTHYENTYYDARGHKNDLSSLTTESRMYSAPEFGNGATTPFTAARRPTTAIFSATAATLANIRTTATSVWTALCTPTAHRIRAYSNIKTSFARYARRL